jgi:hypothetical protein
METMAPEVVVVPILAVRPEDRPAEAYGVMHRIAEE